MKKFLLIIFCMMLTFTFTACSKKSDSHDLYKTVLQRDKLIVGVKYDTKPFGYMDKKGKLMGFDVDLARMIAKEMLGSADKVEFVAVTPQNRIMMLNSGKVDMVVATMSVTEKRKQIVDFSRPYYLAGQALLVKNGSKITSLSEMNGKRIIVIFGTTSERKLRMAVPDAVIVGYKSYVEGYKALLEGKAEGITGDDTILMGFALDDKRVKLLPKRYSKEPYAIAYRKDEDSKVFKTNVNRILNALIESGKITKLSNRWIKL